MDKKIDDDASNDSGIETASSESDQASIGPLSPSNTDSGLNTPTSVTHSPSTPTNDKESMFPFPINSDLDTKNAPSTIDKDININDFSQDFASDLNLLVSRPLQREPIQDTTPAGTDSRSRSSTPTNLERDAMMDISTSNKATTTSVMDFQGSSSSSTSGLGSEFSTPSNERKARNGTTTSVMDSKGRSSTSGLGSEFSTPSNERKDRNGTTTSVMDSKGRSSTSGLGSEFSTQSNERKDRNGTTTSVMDSKGRSSTSGLGSEFSTPSNERKDRNGTTTSVMDSKGHSSTSGLCTGFSTQSNERKDRNGTTTPIKHQGSCNSNTSSSARMVNSAKNRKTMQVLVKTLRGNTVTCDLREDSVVQDLQTAAFHKSEVPADQQCLVFEGKPLHCSTEPLADYGIHNMSTVHMMGHKLRGG